MSGRGDGWHGPDSAAHRARRFVDEHGAACAAEAIQVVLLWPPVSNGLPVLTAKHMRNRDFTTEASGDLHATLAAPIGDVILRVGCHHLKRSLDRLERRLTLTAATISSTSA